MKVVILCGGHGSRVGDPSSVRPKPLVRIGGHPILWHIMKLYAHFGWREFVLCLGYRGDLIRELFLNYDAFTSDCTVRLGPPRSVEVHDPRAEEDWAVTLAETGDNAHTAARVWRARRFLGEGPFCVAYGDGLADVALDELVRFHKSHGRLATVTGVRPPGRYGSLQLAGDGSVTSFVEKPHATAQFVNGGFFVFEPGFIERYLSDDESVDLEGAPLQRATADGELMLWRHERFWQHLDTARDQALLDELWRSGRAPWKLWS